MTTLFMQNHRECSTKALTIAQFERPAIVNTSITSNTQINNMFLAISQVLYHKQITQHHTYIRSIPNATHAYRELCTKPQNHIMFNLQNTFEGDIFVDITRR